MTKKGDEPRPTRVDFMGSNLDPSDLKPLEEITFHYLICTMYS